MQAHESPPADVGVIIGRFQVPWLHEGHCELIDYVSSRHNKVIVILGCSPIVNSTTNPLDFQSRQQMISEYLPSALIVPAFDKECDFVWSAQVDDIVRGLLHAGQTAQLYGSRESFIERYHGAFPVQRLQATTPDSGTRIRSLVGKQRPHPTESFRRGVIWASQARFPTSYQTVDVAIVNDDLTQVLLCRKPGVQHWQFVGGFVDPAKGDSLEDNARREVEEETSLTIGRPYYLGSQRIADWRYAGGPDSIMSAFFVAKRLYGVSSARDDIAEVAWFDIDEVRYGGVANLGKLHRYFGDLLVETNLTEVLGE